MQNTQGFALRTVFQHRMVQKFERAVWYCYRAILRI